ncbi:unnamed protein product [Scytosiphon promiscuus]
MVDVITRRCSYSTCMKIPSFNYKGNKIATYCKQHAEVGMVRHRSTHCSYESCTKYADFNVEGSKTAVFCKWHAKHGMVNIRRNRCSYDSCMNNPNFTDKGGKTPLYCKQHATGAMVKVRGRSCLHDACMTTPNFNAKGRKTGLYCRQHSEEGMVDIYGRQCSHGSCPRASTWGVATDVAPTVCALHKTDVVGDDVINFKSACKVVRCTKVSRYGLCGEQPTHCAEHGPLEGGLARTVHSIGKKRAPSCVSNSDTASHPSRVKTE